MARIEQMGTAARVITPENVSFRYELAGPFVRFIAYLIDLLVMGVLCILFFLMAVAAGMILQTFFNVDVNILNQMGLGVYLIFLFVLTWDTVVCWRHSGTAKPSASVPLDYEL